MTKHTMTLPSGDEIAYWTHNDDKKQTLIMVHGFTGSHEGFQYLVPLLSEYRLIIPDLPGFGVSPLPHSKLTLRELGSLLIDFVQELDLADKPNLVGHSMGSLVSSEAIRQHPSLFAEKVALISPVPTPVSILEKRRPGVLLTTFYYGISHRLPIVGKRLATSKRLTTMSTFVIMNEKDKTMRKKIYDHHYKNLDFISSIGWYSHLYKQLNKTGISRYKAALAPFQVLIINGKNDAITPINQQRKAARTLNAELVVIPSTGHLAHYEKPTDLADALKAFLNSQK